MACVEVISGDLLQGERLLLRAIRLLALGEGCPALARLFDDACGCGGREAFRALKAMVQQLGLHGRRSICLAPPGLAPTADERLILDAFGCAQAEDYRALDERLWRLTGREPPPALGAGACLVAQVFGMSGLVLRPQLALA